MSSTEENAITAINAAADVLKEVRDNGLDKGELDRARNLLKGATARKMESTGHRLYRMTKTFMLTGKAEPFANDLKALDRVTEEDVMRVADDVISSKKLNIAVYGKKTKELSKMTIDQIDL
jgi:predicted Zn-dependent peptidase